MGCLYKLTHVESSKSYIGITCGTAEKRFKDHIWYARHNVDGCRHLSRAIRKYGASAFSVKTLVIINDESYLNDLEIKAIAAFNTLAPFGYNLRAGGNQGIWSEDLKIKARARKLTPEHRAKIKAAMNTAEVKAKTTHFCSLETRDKIREARKRQVMKPHSIETKAKLSAARKGMTFSEEWRARLREAWVRRKARKHGSV